MATLFRVMDIASTGMSAENVRLNTTASNIANANSVSSSYEETYKARHPVFAAELQRATQEQGSGTKVNVLGVVESQKPLQVEYAPGNPLADENGYIYKPNVNVVEEMANMISATRAYQTNIQVADTAKKLLVATLKLGQ